MNNPAEPIWPPAKCSKCDGAGYVRVGELAVAKCRRCQGRGWVPSNKTFKRFLRIRRRRLVRAEVVDRPVRVRFQRLSELLDGWFPDAAWSGVVAGIPIQFV